MAIDIAYLSDHPEHIETCACWIYGLWGCQSSAAYDKVLSRITEGAQRETLPMTLVALHNAKPAGTISLWKTDASRPEFTPWLSALYVHPFHRNNGIAQLLIERLISEANRLNLKALYLVTEEAKHLYERFGWTKIEQITTPYGEASLMKKELEKGAPT